MKVLPKFVSMKKTPDDLAEEKAENMVGGDYPRDLYPYGLCISLCEEELEKLELSDQVDTGDLIHLNAIGRVTSVNKRETDQGQKVRVEIQLTDIALEEEAHEEEGAKEDMGRLDYRKLYTQDD